MGGIEGRKWRGKISIHKEERQHSFAGGTVIRMSQKEEKKHNSLICLKEVSSDNTAASVSSVHEPKSY